MSTIGGGAVQAAIYARVSSDQQAREQTIASQVADLKARAARDGCALSEAFCFLDDGVSGTTLLRPALEKLRDQMAAGLIDRLYVHSPDRLARRYAYQVVLLDECKRHGVEVVFLNRDMGMSPEDDLLLQVQGVIAEYERAKIMERSRRGKLHAARRGAVEVLHAAPYGYRYRPRTAAEPASYVVDEQQAAVVRRIFHWVGVERLSVGEVCRRLTAERIASPRGQQRWSRSTVAGMLGNPAYRGQAAYGRTRVGPRRPQLRPVRGQPETPRRAYSTYATQPQEQIAIAVPALVDDALFAATGEQMRENRQRHRLGQRGARYLLQGLVVCQLCGRALYGKPVTSVYKGKRSNYTYYRCTGLEPYRYGGERLCDNRQVRTERLEETVWQDVCALLNDPERLRQEYEQRLLSHVPTALEELSRAQTRLHKARQGLGRLIDAYEAGLLDAAEFETRIKAARERVKKLEQETSVLSQQRASQEQLQEVLQQWQQFADHIGKNLQKASWATRREIMVALVKRIEVGVEEVNIVYKVPGLKEPNPADSFLQDRPGNPQSTPPTK
jgi:site-specific DNA recombinase